MIVRSLRRAALLGALVLAVTGCAAPPSAPPPPAPRTVPSVETDQFTKTIIVNGIETVVSDASGYRTIDWFMRSGVDKTSHKIVHQIFFQTFYPPPRAHFVHAADDTAHSLEVTLLYSARDCSVHPCAEEEDIGIALDQPTLLDRLSGGYAVKVSARDGTSHILNLTPDMIQQQFAALVQVEHSLGVELAMPYPTPTMDCPPLGVRVALAAAGEVAPKGALIAAVAPGSPADKAGLKAGVLITNYDGKAVVSGEGLRDAIKASGGGRKIAVYVIDYAHGTGAATKWVDMPAAGAMAGPPLGLRVDTVAVNNPALLRDPTLKGAEVTGVDPGSVAEKAGLIVGDVIVACDGTPITAPDQVPAAFAAIHDHGSVRVTVVHAAATERSTYVIGQ